MHELHSPESGENTAYKLIVTEHAEILLDNLVYHLLFRLKNEQAAVHLLNSIDNIYNRLEDNPLQFQLCQDSYLAKKGYHEAVVPEMNYLVIFRIDDNTVYIMGVFHQLENYQEKL